MLLCPLPFVPMCSTCQGASVTLTLTGTGAAAPLTATVTAKGVASFVLPSSIPATAPANSAKIQVGPWLVSLGAVSCPFRSWRMP